MTRVRGRAVVLALAGVVILFMGGWYARTHLQTTRHHDLTVDREDVESSVADDQRSNGSVELGQQIEHGESQQGSAQKGRFLGERNDQSRAPQKESTPTRFPEASDAKDSTDFSEYDKRVGPLELIGIPVQKEPSDYGLLVFSPSDADRERIHAMDEELNHARAQGLIGHAEHEGYEAIPVDPNETVYVSPRFSRRYRAMLKEREAISSRSMRRAAASELSASTMARERALRLPDGTKIEYYRRKDGALIRSVRTHDGLVRKWVIGWADVSRYPPSYARAWRDE
jgi:hypothetical protein